MIALKRSVNPSPISTSSSSHSKLQEAMKKSEHLPHHDDREHHETRLLQQIKLAVAILLGTLLPTV